MGSARTILIAEDNEHDVFLYNRAFTKLGITGFQFVHDGTEVVDYLQGKGKFADRATYPFPSCLWLDLKMPRMTGLEVLAWMTENPKCRVVPTVVLSTSALDSDVAEAYRLGATSFFTKPSTYNETVDLIALCHHYWNICRTPQLSSAERCEAQR